jgi:hypothetical protein
MRRVFTRPLWWWERRRNYGIRSRFNRLPPLPVSPARRSLVVLTTPQSFRDAIWTAWSWYRFLNHEEFELQFVTSAELDKAAIAAIQKVFPGVRIREAESVIAVANLSVPGMESFVRDHPLGAKFGIILALSQQNDILYTDHDVLAFNSPAELLSCVESAMPSYMLEEVEGNLDCAITKRLDMRGIAYFDKFNSGLLYVPEGALSLDLAQELLELWSPTYLSWYTEQTFLSILMRNANAVALPSDRYVISARRQFYWEKDVDYCAIVARHFTGTVRHVMYKFGMPEILRQSSGNCPEGVDWN